MVSEYIAPFRKISDKKTVYDTKGRSSWSPKPSTPTSKPQGNPVGNTKGLNKPVIKSNVRILGQGMRPRHFPVYGKPAGTQQNKVGGAIGRTTAKVLANHMETSTGARMLMHQKNLAKAAKISRGVNLVGLGLAAAEGIYKGAKRALGPEGTKFHTGTGVPVWEDRNSINNKTKLNP